MAATSALHEEVGPARTSIAEIARRADVARLTVYNNFPEERDLFAACSAHWIAANPPPDPTPAFAIADPAERLRAVLVPLYRWTRRNQRMSEHIQRDRLTLPALDAVVAISYDRRVAELAEALAAGFDSPPGVEPRFRVLVALALDFWTWRRFSQEGVTDEAAADLMVEAVRALTRA